jgi:oligoendopeptidase F
LPGCVERALWSASPGPGKACQVSGPTCLVPGGICLEEVHIMLCETPSAARGDKGGVEPGGHATGAEDVLWDLSHLYSGSTDPCLRDDLEQSLSQARSFREAYLGKVGALEAGQLHHAMAQYEAILERLAKAETFSHLWFVTDTLDPARGKLLQEVREKEAQVRTQLLFLELEWVQVQEERAAQLLAQPELAHWRHYLSSARRYRPHLLSEPEERILAEKSVTGGSAWVRFFEETMSDIPFQIDGQPLTEEEVLSRLYRPERQERQKAAKAMTEGLKGRLRTLTFIFNMLASDKAIEDRLRNYPHWLSARNLANEISDQMVGSLVDAVTARYDLPQRYYHLKRRLLGLDALYDYDRYAPLPGLERRVSWSQCLEEVLGAFEGFAPEMAQIAARFFREGWIDAPVRPGKRGGAFSHPAVPSVHPYVMVNFTGKLRDVMTVAHELGHGVHQFLASSRGFLNSQTPLTIAETASVFGEMLTFERIISRLSEPRERLAMLCGKIEDILATVFRQIAMNRFEEQYHTRRREGGELTPEELGSIWIQTQGAMLGDSVVLTEDYSLWWSYIPHFLHTPGYVYAYAFGELLVLALLARFKELGQGFVEGYLEMLCLGGAESPQEVVGRAGLDLNDPGLWNKGLGILEAMIGQAEELAQSV